jgi:hypothetical protein
MCYGVPVAAVLILNGVKKFKKINLPNFDRLNLLLLGGSIMLIVDHWWNGELFLIGKNITKDLFLGVLMTGAVLGVWLVMNFLEKQKNKKMI